MGQYRTSRSFEASIIDYIRDELNGNWSGISVEKTFAKIYTISVPSVCVRLGTTTHEKVEIGTNATLRLPLIWIDLFCKEDGQRLDLKDFLIEILKNGIPYYEYTVTNGQVTNKTLTGRINIINIDDTPIDFDTQKNLLDVHDRHRHLLTLEVSLGKVEA